MKIVSVVGARPQFVKLAALTRALARHRDRGVEHVVVHTGQHYDHLMSQSFFDRLEMNPPDHDLEVGSASYSTQIGEMLVRLEPVLRAEEPDVVVVVGDTNSTLAGALAAAGLDVPVAHVEAGLRSGRMDMPEERNRVLTDDLSTWLFTSSRDGQDNLERIGLGNRSSMVGDVMYDVLLWRLNALTDTTAVARAHGLTPGQYGVATVHRPVNADDPARLGAILEAIERAEVPIILPVHPRIAPTLTALVLPSNLLAVDAQPYEEMISLVQHAAFCLTDSGGVQKEAMWLHTPCVTLRAETEWPETVEAGWNKLVDADTDRIVAAIGAPRPPGDPPTVYGDGRAAERIVEVLLAPQGSISKEQHAPPQ